MLSQSRAKRQSAPSPEAALRYNSRPFSRSFLFRCTSFSRTTARSRPAAFSSTTTPRCRSRRRRANGSRSRRRTCCCGSPSRRRRALLAEAQALATAARPEFSVGSQRRGRICALAISQPTTSDARRARPRLRHWRYCLHASPMHFYKKGKGRYKAAPTDALKAALAGVERKRREAEQIATYAQELQAHRLPDALREKLPMLLYAARQAGARDQGADGCVRCAAHQPSGAAGRLRRDSVDARLPFQSLPVRSVSARDRFPGVAGTACPRPSCPRAPVRAFSIDDAATTEIDDAFSVRPLANGNLEIGIHIAAPALAIPRGTPLDAVARSRLSTVYMPGRKITMLPDAVIELFFAGARRCASGVVAVRRDDARRHAGQARHATGARADRRQLAPRRHRRALRAGRAPRASPNGPTSYARYGGSRRSSNWRAARMTCSAPTTLFRSTGMPRPTAG